MGDLITKAGSQEVGIFKKNREISRGFDLALCDGLYGFDDEGADVRAYNGLVVAADPEVLGVRIKDIAGMSKGVEIGNHKLEDKFMKFAEVDKVIPIGTADPTNPRIDAVYAIPRVKKNELGEDENVSDKEKVTVGVEPGTPAASPDPEELADGQILLAYVTVLPAVTEILAANIEDKRVFIPNMCDWVQGIENSIGTGQWTLAEKLAAEGQIDTNETDIGTNDDDIEGLDERITFIEENPPASGVGVNTVCHDIDFATEIDEGESSNYEVTGSGTGITLSETVVPGDPPVPPTGNLVAGVDFESPIAPWTVDGIVIPDGLGGNYAYKNWPVGNAGVGAGIVTPGLAPGDFAFECLVELPNVDAAGAAANTYTADIDFIGQPVAGLIAQTNVIVHLSITPGNVDLVDVFYNHVGGGSAVIGGPQASIITFPNTPGTRGQRFRVVLEVISGDIVVSLQDETTGADLMTPTTPFTPLGTPAYDQVAQTRINVQETNFFSRFWTGGVWESAIDDVSIWQGARGTPGTPGTPDESEYDTPGVVITEALAAANPIVSLIYNGFLGLPASTTMVISVSDDDGVSWEVLTPETKFDFDGLGSVLRFKFEMATTDAENVAPSFANGKVCTDNTVKTVDIGLNDALTNAILAASQAADFAAFKAALTGESPLS